MPNLVETRTLTRRYGSNTAIDNIALSLDDGGIIGLVGKNGAGKTTLLSLLSGALEPSSGTVNVLGYPASAPQLLGKINILLQEADFKRGISVKHQLIHFAQLQGLTQSEAKNEIGLLLEKLNNSEYAHKVPEAMSYGQRKRLGITQTFIGKPELILLDEPTAGLDPLAAADIRKTIQSFADQTTFIISSHNLYELQDICSRVLVLDKGQLKMNTTLSELNQGSDCLHITLNKNISADLLSALCELPEISEAIPDKTNLEKITLHFTDPGTDKLQLQVQSLILEHGYSVLQLNRGENMLAEILSGITQKP